MPIFIVRKPFKIKSSKYLRLNKIRKVRKFSQANKVYNKLD